MAQILLYAVLITLLLLLQACGSLAPRQTMLPSESNATSHDVVRSEISASPPAPAPVHDTANQDEPDGCTAGDSTCAEAFTTEPAQMHYENQTMQIWAS